MLKPRPAKKMKKSDLLTKALARIAALEAAARVVYERHEHGCTRCRYGDAYDGGDGSCYQGSEPRCFAELRALLEGRRAEGAGRAAGQARRPRSRARCRLASVAASSS